ncbi:hypothetical protein GCM10008983_24810 [Lentibacillus halophilus]|uniref:Uncharacterized protein n=1 Tax=Lentibacillus halophilus TaxID=295065 RepID=A0ABP3JAQ5_9BACI
MKKRYIASVAGAVGAGMTYYMLMNRHNRQRDEEMESTLMDAGMPGQVDDDDAAQVENAKMVSEGSQFGVEYYNTVKDESLHD